MGIQGEPLVRIHVLIPSMWSAMVSTMIRWGEAEGATRIVPMTAHRGRRARPASVGRVRSGYEASYCALPSVQ